MQRNPIRSIILTATLCLLSWSPALGQDLSADDVMREMTTRHQLDSYIATNVMLLQDAEGNQEQRTLEIFYKKMNENESRSLYVFQEPVAVRGVAVLTWNHHEEADDQWLYLPSTETMRRIAQSSKKSYFMGTDITYEDMEPEDLDEYRYSRLDAETIDDQQCYVVEAVPATEEKRRESGYSKRLLWVRQDIFTVVQIEFYDRRERKIKTQTFYDFENVKGACWRARKTLIVNHQRDHQTAVGIQEDQTNVEIEDRVFTERHLSTGGHLD